MMAIRKTDGPLAWQSKTILLLVLPWTAGSVVLQSHWWLTQVPVVAYETLGISALFGLIVWRMRAGTPAAALTGAVITASLMYSTVQYPYKTSWLHGGLMPLLAVFLLTYAATKVGRRKKEQLGTGESRRGRNAAQVAANLGAAALVVFVGPTLEIFRISQSEAILAVLASAALAEAAADTVSSEIGQVMGGRPRMITTLRKVEPGTDGGITLVGTLAGILAAALIATVAMLCTNGALLCRTGIAGCDLVGARVTDQLLSIVLVTVAATFGLLFDSFIGATFERKGWLNNDAVNFLSTLSAPVFFVATATTLYFASR
jgi:uncharacterized protein (TIGR00297 family)